MSLLLEATDPDELPRMCSPQPPRPRRKPAPTSLVDLLAGDWAALADPLPAELLVAETVGTDSAAAALGLLTEMLEPACGAARVAVRWPRAVALDRSVMSRRPNELLAAESMDTEWPPPLLDLARIASDRGDAERASCAAPAPNLDHPLVRAPGGHSSPAALATWAATRRAGAGRAASAKCHLGRVDTPLAERVDWLWCQGIPARTVG